MFKNPLVNIVINNKQFIDEDSLKTKSSVPLS